MGALAGCQDGFARPGSISCFASKQAVEIGEVAASSGRQRADGSVQPLGAAPFDRAELVNDGGRISNCGRTRFDRHGRRRVCDQTRLATSIASAVQATLSHCKPKSLIADRNGQSRGVCGY